MVKIVKDYLHEFADLTEVVATHDFDVVPNRKCPATDVWWGDGETV